MPDNWIYDNYYEKKPSVLYGNESYNADWNRFGYYNHFAALGHLSVRFFNKFTNLDFTNFI